MIYYKTELFYSLYFSYQTYFSVGHMRNAQLFLQQAFSCHFVKLYYCFTDISIKGDCIISTFQ